MGGGEVTSHTHSALLAAAPHMKPFSLVLLSRCSLTMGPSFWKNGCLSGRAMEPGPLVRAYFSHSLLAR